MHQGCSFHIWSANCVDNNSKTPWPCRAAFGFVMVQKCPARWNSALWRRRFVGEGEGTTTNQTKTNRAPQSKSLCKTSRSSNQLISTHQDKILCTRTHTHLNSMHVCRCKKDSSVGAGNIFAIAGPCATPAAPPHHSTLALVI